MIRGIFRILNSINSWLSKIVVFLSEFTWTSLRFTPWELKIRNFSFFVYFLCGSYILVLELWLDWHRYVYLCIRIRKQCIKFSATKYYKFYNWLFLVNTYFNIEQVMLNWWSWRKKLWLMYCSLYVHNLTHLRRTYFKGQSNDTAHVLW
jgi:hypothetical protein